MPAAFALASWSSAAPRLGIDASTTVKALLPGGQPVAAASVGAGVAELPPAGVAPLSPAGAGVEVESVGAAGVGVDAVGGVSAGALCAGVDCVGATAVVLFASPVTAASAIATPIPAISKTTAMTAAGRRQLGGRSQPRASRE